MFFCISIDIYKTDTKIKKFLKSVGVTCCLASKYILFPISYIPIFVASRYILDQNQCSGEDDTKNEVPCEYV